MNCDDAFDALTDPSGIRAVELAAHLGSCSRCRELQKVLEPALDLLSGELPRETCPEIRLDASDSPRSSRSPHPFLTIEAVSLAEQTAIRMSANPGPRPARRRIGQIIGVAMRSAALILFGALAVYCIKPEARHSQQQPLPAFGPQPSPGEHCTRLALQQTGKASQDASTVIASCVACHLKERPRQNLPSTSLLWPNHPTKSEWAELETRRA